MNAAESACAVLVAGLLAPAAGHILLSAAARLRRDRAPACPPAAPPPAALHPGAALAHAQHAVAEAPLSAGAYVQRGTALLLLARYDEAGRDFRRARALDHTAPGAAFGLACAEAAQGRPAAALGHLARAVRLDPAAAVRAATEPLLRNLRDEPVFSTILAGAEALPRAA